MNYEEDDLLDLIERHDENEEFYRAKLAELRADNEATPMTATMFRKRPVTVEARQLTGNTSHDHDVYLWVEKNTQGSFDPYGNEIPASGISIDPGTGQLLIATLEGVMYAKVGDWIISGASPANFIRASLTSSMRLTSQRRKHDHHRVDCRAGEDPRRAR